MINISPKDYRLLPALVSPAGYICLIRDEEYQDRFALIRVQSPSEIDAFRETLVFNTKVEKIFGVTQGAARIERTLLQRYANGDDWFTLSPAQLQEITGSPPPPGRSRRQPRNRPNPQRRWRNLATLILVGLIAIVAFSMIKDSNGIIRWLLAPTATPTNMPSATPVPPTATPTNMPSATPVPPTATPTSLPSATPIPPTATPTSMPSATPVPPTATSTSIPSATPVPPTATPTSLPSATPIPPTVTATHTPLPSKTPTNTPSATPTVPSARKYVVDTAGNQNANIRACPRRSCEIVDKLPAGATIEVLGSVTGEDVNAIDGWFKIKLEDGVGYIHSELAEVAPPSQPSRPSASLERFAAPSRRYTHKRVNTRTGPGAHYPLLDAVPAGAALDVVGKSGDWYLIRRGGAEAYIAGWLTHDAPLPDSGESAAPETSELADSASIEQVAVVQVIDGDTIDVRLHGEIVRVRYIGVDTPERGEPCYADAANYNRGLVQGKTLTLVRDTSDYGPYGRLLRYVYADGVFVNLALVQAGYAEASYYAPNGKHRHDFEAAQRSAPNRGCVAAPAQSNPPRSTSQQPAPQVDNCCFVNRHCHTDAEWQAGYYAYQWNSACIGDAPAPTTQRQQSQPRQSSPPRYSCNCSKTCEQMSSCEEAYFQLNNCGCGRRDHDKDGTPCESICG